jgi:MFS family permease
VLLFALLTLGLAISGIPSPLYSEYQREWHFSSLTVTLIFAVYALAALLALLVVGRLSDSIGRKPVLIGAQLLLLGGFGVFLAADNQGYLLAARALHGAAVGSIAAVAGAALLDLRPQHGARIGRLTGLALNSGMAAGVLGSALLGEFVPHPLIVPYLVAAIGVGATLAGTITMPEPLAPANRKPLNLSIRPRVPAAIRAEFTFTSVTTVVTWAVLGLYLSLAPALTEQAAGSRSLLIGGTVPAVLLGAAALAQLATAGASPLHLAIGGDLLLGAGLLASLGAVTAHSAWAIYLSAVVIGAGLGPAFSGSLRHLSAVIPAAERGQVMSAYYLTGYLSNAVPVVLAGLAASRLGLKTSYLAFGLAAVIICALAAALGARLSRTAVASPLR